MGNFRRKDTAPAQQDLWLRPEEIVTGPHHAFCTKLAVLPEKMGFTETVQLICAPYDRLESREGGRLPVEAFEARPAELLRSLQEHGLRRGRKLGIDALVIVANVSLSGLEPPQQPGRLTGICPRALCRCRRGHQRSG
jgi:hypothetical protein